MTYSHVNLTKFPTRKGFGKCIKKHFNSGSGKVKVLHSAYGKEKYQNRGEYYHDALKLTSRKSWESIKESRSWNLGTMVNFSNNHDNYA